MTRKWRSFSKKGRAGVYDQWKSTACMIVSANRKSVIITPKVFVLLKQPERIQFLYDEADKSLLGLMGIKSAKDPMYENGYSVVVSPKTPDPADAIRYVHAKGVIKDHGLKPGVYTDVIVEDGIFVVNTSGRNGTLEPLTIRS